MSCFYVCFSQMFIIRGFNFPYLWEKEVCREMCPEKSVCDALMCLLGQKHHVPIGTLFIYSACQRCVLTEEAALENQDVFKFVYIL